MAMRMGETYFARSPGFLRSEQCPANAAPNAHRNGVMRAGGPPPFHRPWAIGQPENRGVPRGWGVVQSGRTSSAEAVFSGPQAERAASSLLQGGPTQSDRWVLAANHFA